MEFVKEGLTFTGEDSPMANLMTLVARDFGISRETLYQYLRED